MVKHISKIIKETELYKDFQRRKQEQVIANLKEFLPGISENDMIKRGGPYESENDMIRREKNWRQEQHEKKIFGEVSEIEHKKSTEKPYSNE